MAFNPDQPRIPKGHPGAGRFVKIGAMLSVGTHSRSERGRGISKALFPEDEGRNPMARRSPITPVAGLDFPAGPAKKAPARRKMSAEVHERAYGQGVTKALFPEDAGSGPLAKRSSSGSPRLARAGAALTGKETKAQLQQIAAAERITVGRGSREQMAQTIRDFRYNREHGGARFFGETDFARDLHENPIAAPNRTAPSRPSRRPRAVHTDEMNQDLAGKSASELRAIAAAEGIPVTKGASKQNLVNEISHGRNVRHRGGGRLLARSDM